MKANEILTSKFVEALKNGVAPWSKPWRGISGGPKNAISKKPYRGVNYLLLSMFGADEYFLTFNQAKTLGGCVKKGSKGIPIAFYKVNEYKDKAGNVEKRIPILRYFTVFAVSDCEGLKWNRPEAGAGTLDFKPVEACEKLAAAITAPVSFGGNEACYYPASHKIQMPAKESFKTVEQFYCTLFHEGMHATAKETGDSLEGNFGSEKYSKEELIAELGAAFCVNYCGIYNPALFDNSAAYLACWASKLQNDPQMIISAASKAQKRFDFLLGETNKVEDTVTDESET